MSTSLQHLTSSRWRYLGLIVLLGLYFAQSVAASPVHSVTFDEQYHLTPGYVYLAQRDLRFHRDQNPPLFEAILSAPLLARSDIVLPIDHPAYRLWGDVYLFSDAFFWHSGNNPDSLAHTGRIVAALTGVLLGLLLFVWGRQMFGEGAGWIAVFLFAFDPNFIANAIPTLDLPLAFTSTLAMFALWHCLKRPTAFTLILTGLALGFALATKFLSVMLLPSFFIVLLIYPHPPGATRYSPIMKRLLVFGLMLLIAWGVLWATYLFQFGPIGGAGLPVPAPQYFESFSGMFFKSSEGRANYLLGQVSTTGWWYYFVGALLIKTPLPTLIAIVFALIRWPWRREWRTSSVLYLPALFFFLSASLSQLQLGYRYLLPVLPFLFLMAGRASSAIPSEARNLAAHGKRLAARLEIIISTVLAVWLVISALITFPHHLSYFNELVGGSNNGYKYLTDSNVDWGQDLPALKNWIDRTRPERLHLAFFGSAYPDRYGVNAIGIPSYPNSAYGTEAEAFTSYSLEPGQYAISATLLRIGLVARLFNAYQAFESMTPIAQPAPSILIYDVQFPDSAAIDRAVLVGPPAADVAPQDLGYREGQPLRAKWCRPGECFIFTPHPARYLTLDLPDAVKNLAADVPSPVSSYRVYQLDASTFIDDKLNQLRAVPVLLPDNITTTFPITFENGLALAGYEIDPSRGLMVNTYWHVADRVQPPVTVFVHLLDREGKVVAQNDSFGAATRMLETGDLIVQQHPIKFEAPVPRGDYRLEIGLYNPVTSNRFQTMTGADHVLGQAIQIGP